MQVVCFDMTDEDYETQLQFIAEFRQQTVVLEMKHHELCIFQNRKSNGDGLVQDDL